MNYPKAKSFDSSLVSSKIMGPNPLFLTEELFQILEQGTEVCSKNHPVPRPTLFRDPEARVCVRH
mgnify:CR=1 FL=1